MNILLFGNSDKNFNTYLLGRAFKKNGQKINFIDITKNFNNFFLKIINFINYRSDIKIFNFYLLYQLKKKLRNYKTKIDLIIIFNFEFYGKIMLNYLKSRTNCKIVLYTVDNPFANRDLKRFSLFKKIINFYDYFFVVRKQTYKILKKRNKKVFLVRRSYDEDFHRPYFSKNKSNDIIFVGTWMRNENRDYYLKELILNKFKVKIFGNRWHKSKYYKILKPYVFPAIYKRQYAKEISKSKICLCFLSRGNQDQDTIRTYEIPYMGGLLLAERTKVHLDTYTEGKEAVFFNSAKELIAKIKFLLSHPVITEKIRTAGMKKVRTLKNGNMDIAKFILSKVKKENYKDEQRI